MIISPKAALFLILEADSNTSLSISSCVSLPVIFRSPRWCMVASTMMTAPSTIRPKSIAPRLIKLADIPKTFIMPRANSIDNGMADATISPARKFPRNRTNTKITMSAPSIRFFSTVEIARFTRSVRSRNGSIVTSAGSDFCIVGSFSFIRLTTSALLAPLSIIIKPPTASFSPLYVSAPYRTAPPKRTSATSFISIGMPLGFDFTTIFFISSNEPMSPTPRMKYALGFLSI